MQWFKRVSYYWNFYAMVLEAFCFGAVHLCPCVLMCSWVHDHILIVCEHAVLRTACGNFAKFTDIQCILGTEINWLNFEVKRLIRSGSHWDQIWSNKQLGGIFSQISGMRGFVWMKLISVTYNSVRTTQVAFSRSQNQRSRSQSTFAENALFC